VIEPIPSSELPTGIVLSRAFHQDVVRPILQRRWPGMLYTAGRLGQGSDVLGLDDAMSTDHDWGLRLTVLVQEEQCALVWQALDAELPGTYRGFPVRFAYSGSDLEIHHIDVASPASFARDRLGFDPCSSPTTPDWLSVTGQAVLEVTGGPLFEDQLAEPAHIRRALSWYPAELWRYVVACDWARIDQELPLMARAGDRGDELGSRVIASRIVDISMHLAFLVQRAWAPYSKWRGTLFRRLDGVEDLSDHLLAILDASTWMVRQRAIGRALDALIRLQSSSELGARTQRAAEPFWDRPYLQVESSIIQGLMDQVSDPIVNALPIGVGSIEQRTDNVDILTNVALRRALIENAGTRSSNSSSP
jgi:hypothetical protein